MKWTKIEPGRHTLSFEIDGLRYSLLVRSRWYDFLLPFNISLLGHEVGRYQAPLEIPKNNSNYYFIGYGLASILSALLVTHTVTLNLFLMNLFKISLYFVGLILVVFWFNRKKEKMAQNEFEHFKRFLTGYLFNTRNKSSDNHHFRNCI